MAVRARCGLCYSSVIDPVIIAESGRFQSGERRPSAHRAEQRLSRSRASSQESEGSEERGEVRERVTHSEPRIIEVSSGQWRVINVGHSLSWSNHDSYCVINPMYTHILLLRDLRHLIPVQVCPVMRKLTLETQCKAMSESDLAVSSGEDEVVGVTEAPAPSGAASNRPRRMNARMKSKLKLKSRKKSEATPEFLRKDSLLTA